MTDFHLNEIRRLQVERKMVDSMDEENDIMPDRIGLTSTGQLDADIYGDSEKGRYLSYLPTPDEELEMNEDEPQASHPSTRARINAPRSLLDESLDSEKSSDSGQYREQYGSGIVNTRISDRESEVR